MFCVLSTDMHIVVKCFRGS